MFWCFEINAISPCIYARGNSDTNATTSCKSLVKIGPVTSAENSLENRNCAANWPQYDDRRSFGTLAFKNGLECRNFDLSRLIYNQSCTLCINFVRFGSVTPEFKT